MMNSEVKQWLFFWTADQINIADHEKNVGEEWELVGDDTV